MMDDPPIRRLTRSKSSDEMPILLPRATRQTPSSPHHVHQGPWPSPQPVGVNSVTDIDSPQRSPRRMPPMRSSSAAIPGSRRPPPLRTHSGLHDHRRNPLTRTHTGDGMQEMAAWRQEQLANRLGGGPAPPVRTHSKITDLARLREQQLLLQNAPLLNEEESDDMSSDESSSMADYKESEDESVTLEDDSSDDDDVADDDEDDDEE